jgi:hypothetical protein
MPEQLSKRALASRANGAKSRGPKTEQGKRRSAQNSLRHGLLAKCILLDNECRDTFQIVHQYHLEKFNPADDVEHSAVEEMVAAAWRLRRIWTIETALFDNKIGSRTDPTSRDRMAAAFSELAAGNELNLLDRYEARLHRAYQRALSNFLALREFDATPLPNEPDAEIDTADPVAQPEAAPSESPLPNEPNKQTPPSSVPEAPNLCDSASPREDNPVLHPLPNVVYITPWQQEPPLTRKFR